MRILMNGQILMKNLNTQPYSRKNTSNHYQKMVNAIKAMNIFLMNIFNIWNIFNFNIFEDFHDHYLRKDVLLLADVFEKFISTCLKYYDLDPCHYFSAPGLSWDAMLKMTGVALEKISDPDKYMFFEQGMRGRVSYINKRYSKTSKNVNISFIWT